MDHSILQIYICLVERRVGWLGVQQKRYYHHLPDACGWSKRKRAKRQKKRKGWPGGIATPVNLIRPHSAMIVFTAGPSCVWPNQLHIYHWFVVSIGDAPDNTGRGGPPAPPPCASYVYTRYRYNTMTKCMKKTFRLWLCSFHFLFSLVLGLQILKTSWIWYKQFFDQ